jgi:4-hydroxy-2-oxoheptanedioate aldolase
MAANGVKRARGPTEGGPEFKQDLRDGKPKMGIFLNSASPTVAEMCSHLGYDWLLVDTQHGPMNPESLSSMLCAISSGDAKSMVRVGGAHDRNGVQQALDLGADGILIPYINNEEEAKQAISMCLYPTAGTRSVYFPQRSTHKRGLLGYVPNANKQVIVALQVETADCIKNIDKIAALPGLDILFLGQNDLCMSMGLFEREYVFPQMYTSKELNEATTKLIDAAKKNNKILGLFLFGTERVKEFIEKGFTFISIGNDLHHLMTQANAHADALEDAADGKWTRNETGISGPPKKK